MDVSYIITTYNRPALLNRAAGFIVAERCPDSELIIVDDHGQAAAELPPTALEAFGDHAVLVRNPENLGVIGARNAGIKKAQGRYILFLDDDDASLPNRTRDLLHVIENTDYDFVCARAYMGNGDRVVPPAGNLPLNPARMLRLPSHIDAVIWRREALLESGGLDNRVPYLGEHITLLTWLMQGKKGYLSNDVVARFTYLEDGLTVQTSQADRMKKELLAFYAILAATPGDPAFSTWCREMIPVIRNAPLRTFDDYLTLIGPANLP